MTEHNNSEHVGQQPGPLFRGDENPFDLVNDSVMTRTIEGTINFWNRRAEELYGWRKEEALGKVSHNLLHTQFPKPLEEIDSELVRNGRWEGKLVHTTRDGRRVVVESRWRFEPKGQSEAVVEINSVATSKSPNENEILTNFANVVLFAGGSLAILVSFYFVYYYAWARTKHFTSTVGILLYCVFPAALGTLLFAFSRRSREFKVNTVIFCLSIAASLYVAEVLLTFSNSSAFPPGPIWGNQIRSPRQKDEVEKLARQFGVNFDTRSKLQVINDLRNQAIDAVPSIAPMHLLKEQGDGTLRSDIVIDGREIGPLSGIANRVTVACNESGEYLIYESDEHGFHNPKGIWNPNRVDIAAVGDSFTQGFCVRSDKSFVGLIRQRHPATLNLGMASEGPFLTLATLREYLPGLKPKVVLWFYAEENDLWDLNLETKSPLLMRYMQKDFKQGLLSRQADIDAVLADYVKKQELLEMSKELAQQKEKQRMIDAGQLANFVKLGALRQKLGLLYGEEVRHRGMAARLKEPDLALLRNVLLQAQASVSGWNGGLYFVYLPAWNRYGKQNVQNNGQAREQVLALVESLRIPLIDLHPAFKAQGDPLSLFPFRRFGHYGEEGHRLIAETVLQSIPSPTGS